MMTQILISLLLLPIMLGSLNILSRRGWLSYYITLLTTTLTSVAAACILMHVMEFGEMHYYFGGWLPPIGIALRINLLSALFLNVISGAAFFTCLYGKNILYNEINEKKIPLLCSIFLICLAGLFGIILTNDFFNLYVFIEIASLSTYALVSIGYNRSASKSAFYYLIAGTIGATFILLGIGFLYSSSGTLNMTDFTNQLSKFENVIIIKVASYLMLIGLFIKCGLFPLHSWMVDAYRNSNSFVLTFIGSISTKAYIVVLLKLIYFVFMPYYILGETPIQNFMFVCGVLAIVVGASAAIHQNDFRSMLAFSSVSQIGFIFIAVATGTNTALASAIILIISHVIAKLSLFMISSDIYYQKRSYHISVLYSISKESPFTLALFIANAGSLIGIPLTAGFIGKFTLIIALAESKLWVLIAVVAFGSFVTFKYLWRFFEIFTADKKTPAPSIASNNLCKIVAGFLTAVNILIGVSYTTVVELVNKIVNLIN